MLISMIIYVISINIWLDFLVLLGNDQPIGLPGDGDINGRLLSLGSEYLESHLPDKTIKDWLP